VSAFPRPGAAALSLAEQADRSAQMRRGHPQIQEGDDYLIELFRSYVERGNGQLSVLNVGAGSGYFTKRLTDTFSGIDLAAQEDHPDAIEALRLRMAGSRARLFIEAFERWEEPVDVVLSWGAHHHLPRTYLEHSKRILAPGGVLVLGDEFCPEYCHGEHARRIEEAAEIFLARGHVLTRRDEVEAFEARGELPEAAKELEQLRRRALWHWYKYVIDTALECGCIDVALYELRASRDDLDTGCGDEHKLSPRILERELALRGFDQRTKFAVGASEPPELQSFFIYECIPGR
jgi:SAM-dependent methyltransferase